MRRLLALALPVVAAIGMFPAAAAPVETSRVAEVSFDLPAGDEATTHITLDATRGSAGDLLQATVVTCARSCGTSRYFAGRLPSGALELDAQQASGRLRTSLGGLRLQVTWASAVGAGVVRGYADGNSVSSGTYRGESAIAALNIAGRGCQGPATVGTAIDASVSSAPTSGEPLSRLRLPARGVPTCTG